jgi:hypothetical protein
MRVPVQKKKIVPNVSFNLKITHEYIIDFKISGQYIFKMVVPIYNVYAYI